MPVEQNNFNFNFLILYVTAESNKNLPSKNFRRSKEVSTRKKRARIAENVRTFDRRIDLFENRLFCSIVLPAVIFNTALCFACQAST